MSSVVNGNRNRRNQSRNIFYQVADFGEVGVAFGIFLQVALEGTCRDEGVFDLHEIFSKQNEAPGGVVHLTAHVFCSANRNIGVCLKEGDGFGRLTLPLVRGFDVGGRAYGKSGICACAKTGVFGYFG